MLSFHLYLLQNVPLKESPLSGYYFKISELPKKEQAKQEGIRG